MKNESIRVLHAAALMRVPQGISTQMRWEHEAALELGIEWKSVIYTPGTYHEDDDGVLYFNGMNKFNGGGLFHKTIYAVVFRLKYYIWLARLNKYDLYILRYYVHDPFQLIFLTLTKKTICLMHHTLEEPELKRDLSAWGKFRTSVERYLGPQCIRRSAAVLAVTNEIGVYEQSRAKQKKKIIIYPNGANYRDLLLKDQRGSTPEVLFVAGNFVDWHGLDKLIVELKKSNWDYRIHLIGIIYDSHLDLIDGDNRFVIHGPKAQEDILKISSRCWIGLSSFNLAAKDMSEACTLKVREYLVSGLPVYSGHYDVFDPNFIFYKHGDCDHIAILDYAKKMRTYTKKEVALSAKKFIDKKNLLIQLYEKLNKIGAAS